MAIANPINPHGKFVLRWHSFRQHLSHDAAPVAAAWGNISQNTTVDIVEAPITGWHIRVRIIFNSTSTAAAQQLEVPLLCAEMHCTLDSQSGSPIVLVKPALGCRVSIAGVWGFRIEGGPDAVYHALRALGKGGTIRGDLARCISYLGPPVVEGEVDVHPAQVTEAWIGGTKFSQGRRWWPFQFGLGGSLGKRVRGLGLGGAQEPAGHAEEGFRVKLFRKPPVVPAAQVMGGLIPHQIRREVAITALVQGQQNVILLWGLIVSPINLKHYQHGIATEFCQGGNLEELGKTRLSEAEVNSLIGGVLRGLEHVHLKSIVHRGLKAGNILLRQDRTPVISDFALACHVSDTNALGRACGALGYMAPELRTGGAVRGQQDVFSIGCLFYFLLAGALPFQGKEAEAVLWKAGHETVNLSTGRIRSLSDPCKELVMALLDKSPQKRPTAAVALKAQWFQMDFLTEVHRAPSLAQEDCPRDEELDTNQIIEFIRLTTQPALARQRSEGNELQQHHFVRASTEPQPGKTKLVSFEGRCVGAETARWLDEEFRNSMPPDFPASDSQYFATPETAQPASPSCPLPVAPASRSAEARSSLAMWAGKAPDPRAPSAAAEGGDGNTPRAKGPGVDKERARLPLVMGKVLSPKDLLTHSGARVRTEPALPLVPQVEDSGRLEVQAFLQRNNSGRPMGGAGQIACDDGEGECSLDGLPPDKQLCTATLGCLPALATRYDSSQVADNWNQLLPGACAS